MRTSRSLLLALVLALALALCGTVLAAPRPARALWGRKPGDYIIKRQQNNGLQTVVEYDEHSLFINGERIMIWSGEVHPWRLPVSDLWTDVFEKIKALGFNGVSFYVHWGLVEYKKGDFNFEGIRSYDPFFAAAKEAGIYLIARPGPYINAETTGGGFPGWGTRVPGAWRSNNETYLDAMSEYVATVGRIIADNQITNDGPIILIQPENEFFASLEPWPQTEYMQILEDGFNDAGVVVPFILNDVSPSSGNFAPGSGEGAVDIYGYDSYPQGFDCANPTTWNPGSIPTNYWQLHLNDSPTTQNAILEFQGGAFDPWGGPGYDSCAILLNNEFERVFYKNLMSFSTTLMNMYMIFGGTNWGGIAHPAIDESRLVTREKYSELKLEANFLKVSPAYLTTQPLNDGSITGAFTNTSAIAVTQTADVVGNKTVFWVVRHSDYTSHEKTFYKLQIPTSVGNLTIPQLNGSLTLDGRDSKVHVSDYAFGLNHTLLYSTAEIFTWKVFGAKTVLVLYGSAGETHETAFPIPSSSSESARSFWSNSFIKTSSGTGNVRSSATSQAVIMNYETSGQTVVEVGSDLIVYILDRNTAYNFWVPDLPGTGDMPAYSTANSVIVKGAYLIRSAAVSGSTLQLRGDLNASSAIEVYAGDAVSSVQFNGQTVNVTNTTYGSLTGQLDFSEPEVSLPDLSTLTWKVADSLPEVSGDYDDSLWTVANITVTPNSFRKLTTPTSLYAGDYGYHTGNILFRGHFTSSGNETTFSVTVQGGAAFGFSVWLNSDFLGSHAGFDASSSGSATFSFDALAAGSNNVITVVQDHQGMEEDFDGDDEFKSPRGILNYNLGASISWKLTGNIGGEDYIDRVRGPLNEGGLFAERQGWHLPGFDTSSWEEGSPLDGISSAGVAFYKTNFDLDLPEGYDIPLVFTFTNTTTVSNFRAQIYVNGYQFGKYANNVGPQIEFPVPEGILNYQGSNSLGVSLWAMDAEGAKLGGLALKTAALVETSLGTIEPSEQPAWESRPGAY